MYFCFLNSFCMCFASNEQSRILIRYQYFFCNRKTRWQLSLYSERHQNVRIYHGKYDMFVPIERLSTSFKIVISMTWNVFLNAVNALISFLPLYNHILVLSARYMIFEARTSSHPILHDCPHKCSLKLLCCPHDCDQIFA